MHQRWQCFSCTCIMQSNCMPYHSSLRVTHASGHVSRRNNCRENRLSSDSRKRMLSASPQGGRGGVTHSSCGRPAATSSSADILPPHMARSCSSREPPSEAGHAASFASPESKACRSLWSVRMAQRMARKQAARSCSCAGSMPAAASSAEWWARRGRPRAVLTDAA